jgi:hypothetical protein
MSGHNPMVPRINMNTEIRNTFEGGEWNYEAARDLISATDLPDAYANPADLQHWLFEIARAFHLKAMPTLPWKTSAKHIVNIGIAAHKLQSSLAAAKEAGALNISDRAFLDVFEAQLDQLQRLTVAREREALHTAKRFADRPHDAMCWLLGGALPLIFWVIFSRQDVPFPDTDLPQDEARARIRFIQGCCNAYGLEAPTPQNIHKQLGNFKAEKIDPNSLFFIAPPGNSHQRDRLVSALEAMAQ